MQLIPIQQRIYDIRSHKVMLDFDLAELYEVTTSILNQAVKRNIGRFPEDFMFRLSISEWEQVMTDRMRSQFVIASQKKRNQHITPFAFTEHGITMLASVLSSKTAINVNIAIIRAFIALRQWTKNYEGLAEEINEIRQTVANHGEQLNLIYEAIENLLDDKAEQKTWKDRPRIGFLK